MGAKKINVSMLKQDLRYSVGFDGSLEIKGAYVLSGSYVGQPAGGSKVTLHCPACGSNTPGVSYWSFCGGGKRCERCHSLLQGTEAIINVQKNVRKKDIPALEEVMETWELVEDKTQRLEQ